VEVPGHRNDGRAIVVVDQFLYQKSKMKNSPMVKPKNSNEDLSSLSELNSSRMLTYNKSSLKDLMASKLSPKIMPKVK